MSKRLHFIYIFILVAITVATLAYLSYLGYSYYQTSLEERFYHEQHDLLKPSGILGHGIGILGSLLILIGVFGYMARKRYRSLSRLGLLKHWLEFHIFLCTEGAILILFHTSFKFGGIVSISFWSMVAVVVSGVIGRFIYIQIPRTIEGRELNLQEVLGMKMNLTERLQTEFALAENQAMALGKIMEPAPIAEKKSGFGNFIQSYVDAIRQRAKVRSFLRSTNLSPTGKKQLVRLIRTEISLNRKIQWLSSMQMLFKYWHVAHLPFALIMLVIMIIHVGVTLLFGYKWIF